MLEIDTFQLIEFALLEHEKGNFKIAKQTYQKILQIKPQHFDALQLLGVLLIQEKKFSQAEFILKEALNLNKSEATVWNNLGIALQELSRPEDALISYDKAINLNANYVDAYFNRAKVLKLLGYFEESLLCYDQAIQIKDDDPYLYFYKANLLMELEYFHEALISYEQAIFLKPKFSEAFGNRGMALLKLECKEEALISFERAIDLNPQDAISYNNRGNALKEFRLFDSSLESYDKAISIRSNYREAFNNRGILLGILNRYEEALENLDKALVIKADYIEAINNKGIVLKEMGRFDDAMVCFKKSIQINPRFADAICNLGLLQQDQHMLENAMTNYRLAISLRPDFVEAHWNLALCNLLAGNFREGWQGYEWRWKRHSIIQAGGVRKFSQPLWLGGDSIRDKTIFIYCEQGLGDTIQFSRYLTMVSNLGAKVIFEVQPELFNLMKSLEGVTQVLRFGEEIPEFDFQCPLMSLPLVFKTELNTIPQNIPYLCCSKNKFDFWQKRLEKHIKFRVGLVWSGGYRMDQPEVWGINRRRNIPLEKFSSLKNDKIQFYSLQKGEQAELELKGLKLKQKGCLEIIDFTKDLMDFTDTAAFIENLDLVISVDTSTAHLAGALGKSVWVLNRFDTCWRWMLDTKDTNWYPSMKLFRQSEPQDWDYVISKVGEELNNLTEDL